MNNELFELCKEVYEKTEWEDSSLTEAWILVGHGDYVLGNRKRDYKNREAYPLYTSDYLLEKLPRFILKEEEEYWVVLEPLEEDKWAGCYGSKERPYYDSWADTPLKALLKLTIALDSAGVKL